MSSSTPGPTPHYLRSEPEASVSLRLLADGLNETAYKSFLSPKINSPPYIGFDLEWKPSLRRGIATENPIAVVQIGYQEDSYVIHISWIRTIPDGLKEILENPRIVKVGVGIQHDAKKLYRDLGISLTSCVDLSLFVKCVDYGLFAERLDRYADIPLSSAVIADPPPPSSSKEILNAYYSSEAFLGHHIHRLFRGSYKMSVGLARLTEMYTGIKLTKGEITKSNWEAMLSEAQITYAALDAYAGYIVYAHLINLYNLLSQKPMRRFYAFDCIRGRLYHCSGDTSRTLPAQQIEDPDSPMANSSNMHSSPVFRPVWDEISLHLQGTGEDQPQGLVRWTQFNPEYNMGPTRSEAKAAARIERQKKKEEKWREEGYSSGLQAYTEGKLAQRNVTEKSNAPNRKPQQQAAKAPRVSRGNVPPAERITSVTSTQAVKVVQPRAPIVSQGYIPPSEQQGKSEAVVMTTVEATASAGVSKPPGKNKQKRQQTKPRPATSVSAPAPKKKEKKPFNPHPCQRGNWEGDYLGLFPEIKGYGHLKCRKCGLAANSHP